jgi:hypothetical protein
LVALVRAFTYANGTDQQSILGIFAELLPHHCPHRDQRHINFDWLPFSGARTRESVMRFSRKALLGVLIAITGVVFLWLGVFPTASYRYRLTIAVEVDGQVHTGSSVIEVRYRFYPQFMWPVDGLYRIKAFGEAAVVEVGPHSALVATLGGSRDQTTVAGDFLAARALQPFAKQGAGWYAATLERVRALSQITESVDLTPDNMPFFIWFPDKNDPGSGRETKPGNFSSVIGDGAHLVSAKVQITNDPIVIDIPQKLPLYEKLPQPPWIISSKDDPPAFSWAQFIAAGSVQ